MGSRFNGWNKVTSQENKKVKNATKVEVDGIKFDSKLEAHFYGLLKMHGIPFKMKEKIVLQEKFRYNGELIREIAIIPDFIVTTNGIYTAIDTKGWQTQDNKIKIKLLKKVLASKYAESRVLLPKNQKECAEVISLLRQPNLS